MSEFTTFSALELPEPIIRAITEMGFTAPTPIQQRAIGPLLEGRDVLGEAQTGTGKTAAFGLPALANIDTTVRGAQLLVVAPTRELAIQVAESLEQMGKFMRGLSVATVYGGAAYGPQIKLLKGGAQVVVGTPGRLMDHINKGTLDLSKLKMSVLDEADEMLNMGFVEDIEFIMESVPKDAQRALFSATMPPQIRKIAQKFLSNSVHVQIEKTQEHKANITQKAWKVSVLSKNTALERILETTDYNLALIFVRTRQDTITLAEHLQNKGFKAAGLNGDMNQAQREATVSQLKAGSVRVLVATDVVARGLDVPGVSHVINYDLPNDAESYVHRIGRTGRAGRSGEAILFARPREMHLLRRYERETKGTIEMMEVPTAREMTAYRLEACQKRLADVVANQDLNTMRELVEQMANDGGVDMKDLAAALLFEQQQTRPLFVKDDPKPRREEREVRGDRFDRSGRSDRGDRGAKGRDRFDKGAKGPRKGKGRESNIEFETYRLSVGKDHGARPGDIVGAIANEANMDSRMIGNIKLHGEHSYVELPKGLPAAVVAKLQRARIRQQPSGMTKV
ncbi:DEAD/DEAH box helicase [Aliidiomarina maris]|uniref:DEAD-box ATP-dependent RNA helicase RhpA n=1 Tax=Aliidiomarina maris TaxID=531312 RepID=A0A327WR36_9GAMM|nr:DEAD/DEAH box helicase [Aliidiomarina maris]RAJ93547.1 ATP-dependent RNA helicase CsdA [Aliidiomarina maris]RUO20097.1 ATP-dependent RNA helicase [Aliidiomarina maris]